MVQPARRAREIVRTREDILEAAARALSGSGSATMRHIAREAGYTAASLYTYFRSKEEILAALADLLGREILATFAEPVARGLTFPQRLELLLRQQLGLADRRRDMLFVFFSQRRQGPVSGRRLTARARGLELYCERLAVWLGNAASPTELGGHDVTDAAYFFVGTAHAFFVRWMLGKDRSARLADRTDMLIDLFLHGVGGPRSAARRGAR